MKNKDYLSGIAENDYKVLELIYKHSLPEVSKHIKKNSGTFEDAKDVFQEGILVVFKQVREEKLTLTTSFHNYLFSVCKKIWLKKLKKKSRKEVAIQGIEEYSYEETFEEDFIKTKKWGLFNKQFQLLPEECQKVLKMMFNGRSSKEIAQEMGYTEEYAKRKKYKCKSSLSTLIKDSSEYKNLKK
jgi:RNA polymerase sigma factor (sigma-70 family)